MAPKRKVLVVDDSDIVLHWVESALSAEFEVIGLTSAVDTAATIYREKPDLVLLDVKMPVLRGDHIVTLARESAGDRPLPVVLFSGMPADELAEKAASCGADGFIQKSGDIDSFVMRVKQVFSRETGRTGGRAALQMGRAADVEDRKLLLIAGPQDWLSKEAGMVRDVFRVLRRPTGQEVQKSVRSDRPALVVLGTDLPDIGATELCRRLRGDKSTSGISCLFVGETTDRERSDDARSAGVNDVLLKPYEDMAFLEAVSRLADVAVRRATRLLVRMEVGLSHGDEFQVGFTHNLSASGMLVESEYAANPGESLKLRFFLPGQPRELVADAEVIRVQGERGGRTTVGLQFTYLSLEDRTALEQFVHGAR